MTLRLRYAARSHTGLLREGNEDSLYAGPRVLAVADGMGGHAAGEVASAVAIAAIAQLDEDVPGGDLLDVLRGSAESANSHLRDMVNGDTTLDGMGTTLTAFLFAGSRLGLMHIGDSRAYLLREGTLSQITHDHTLVQTLVDEGRISEEEASTHPQRSLITRALDGRDAIEPDLSVREVRAGDRYLLCSDGLTGPVGRLETLREALEIPDPQEACDRLVQLALRGGGPDNITVIVADVVDGDRDRDSAPVVAGAAASAPQAAPDGAADSPAARARAAEGRDHERPSRAAAAAGGDAPPHARHNVGRAALIAGLVLALLAVGAGAGYAYVRSQYFVGVEQGQVAIFRGVQGSLIGVPLASVAERTELQTDQLDSIATSRVEQGIVADDRDHAQQIVERLRTSALPDCDPSSLPDDPLSSAAALPSGAPVAVPSTAPSSAPLAPTVEACPDSP